MKAPLVLLALLGTLVVRAQPHDVVPKNIRAANTLANMLDQNRLSPYDNLYGIPLETGSVVGTTYLNPAWNRTTILMYDAGKMIEGYDMRYELDKDQFEIRTSEGIKILNGKRVKSFVWVDSATRAPQYFVNARDYKKADDVPIGGFFEVLAEGHVTLLARTHVTFRQPTYNEKFDTGDRNTRVIRKTAFYYMEGEVVRELPSTKKKLLPVFAQHADAEEDFIKVNGLSLSNPGHLKALFEDYNDRITD